VNGDGFGVLLFGVPGLYFFTTLAVGGAFVVFGKLGGGFGKSVNLVGLSAANGFSIIGKIAEDQAGQA
jgi:hypothetical protein